MSLTFHDMFCGAGGSTLGALQAGATPSIGMNHWQTACDSYDENHSASGGRAACVDVVTQDPRRYPRADLLLASPECTHHSYARGKQKDDPGLFDPDGDQGAQRSRATMWDVVRFAEAHAYRAVIVENVGAAVKWGLRRGQKLKHGHYGPLFVAWLQPNELKIASGFTPTYVLKGNKRDQVCQVGNAVTAPAEAELVRRVIASLA